jgi:hypothetical protein
MRIKEGGIHMRIANFLITSADSETRHAWESRVEGMLPTVGRYLTMVGRS